MMCVFCIGKVGIEDIVDWCLYLFEIFKWLGMKWFCGDGLVFFEIMKIKDE